MTIRTAVLTAFTNAPVYYHTLGDRMMIRVCVTACASRDEMAR